MHHDFWHDRWQTGQIGFHQSGVHPFLERWWPSLGVPGHSRVYVPLCGKSLDMVWLTDRGHAVVGSELSPLAIDDFFAGRQLVAMRHADRGFVHHAAGPFEIFEGDAIELTPDLTGPVGALYDRAALVALPPDMRAPYVASLAALLRRGSRGLLVAFEYPQEMKGGPPFSVGAEEVRRLFGDRFAVRELERLDVLATSPKFAAIAIPALHEIAYALERT